MKPSAQQIRSLYKELLRYGQQLQFTDKEYFKSRIHSEFFKARYLTEESEIERCYKVMLNDDHLLFDYPECFQKGQALLDRQTVV